MEESYEDIWEAVESTGIPISKEEFDNLVKDLYSKAKSLLTKRAAAIIIARNLGVDVFQIVYPPIVGRVLEVGPIKYSKSKDGEVPYVLFTLVDDKELYMCVAFGEHHIRLLKDNEDKVVRLKRYLRTKLKKYEIVKVTERSIIEVLDDSLLPPITELKPAFAPNLKYLKESGRMLLVRFLVIAEERSYKDVCPVCGRTLEFREGELVCPEHGQVEPEMLSILRLIVSDGSGTFPAVSFVEPPTTSLQDKIVIAKGYFKGDELQIRRFYKVEEVEIDVEL